MSQALHILWEVGGLPIFMLIGIASWSVGLLANEITTILTHKQLPPTTLPILGVLAAVAPLVGLLGTVMGLVVCFSADIPPDKMAAGISQALLTTQIGLIVALPTLLARQLLLRWRERRFANTLIGSQA